MMTAIMKEDAILLGTQLRLKKGEKVKLVAALNLPDPQNKGFFVSPINGEWGEDSILLNVEDMEQFKWII